MSEDRDPAAAVMAAAEWTATDPATRIKRPIIPHLRQTFGLSLPEAIEAVRCAELIRKGKAA